MLRSENPFLSCFHSHFSGGSLGSEVCTIDTFIILPECKFIFIKRKAEHEEVSLASIFLESCSEAW